jgi:hypothetical protein
VAAAGILIWLYASVKLGLSATPTFLVGRRLADGRVQVVQAFTGARPGAEFEATLDAALDTEHTWWPYVALGAGLVVVAGALVGRRRRRGRRGRPEAAR